MHPINKAFSVTALLMEGEVARKCLCIMFYVSASLLGIVPSFCSRILYPRFSSFKPCCTPIYSIHGLDELGEMHDRLDRLLVIEST